MYSAFLALAIWGSAAPPFANAWTEEPVADDRAPNDNMDFRLNATDGESLNAERFDAWLASKGIRIAGGPATPAAVATPIEPGATTAANALTDPADSTVAAIPAPSTAPVTTAVAAGQPPAPAPVVKRDQ